MSPPSQWAQVLALSIFLFSGVAGAFDPLPSRQIGPPGDQRTVGASIGGQGGWRVSAANAGNLDNEITAALAFAGSQSWRVSNWYSEGTVAPLRSPLFPAVGEAGSTTSEADPAVASSIGYGFAFLAPSGDAGSWVSLSLGNNGRRKTYIDFRDDGVDFEVRAIGVVDAGPGVVNDDAYPFDDAGVDYQIESSGPLARDTWYRLEVQADFIDGQSNDEVTVSIYDSSDTLVASMLVPSWEQAYFSGAFGTPPGTRVASNELTFRVADNADDFGQRNFNTYSSNRPLGIHIDALLVRPAGAPGYFTSFEQSEVPLDLYVDAVAGFDVGNCDQALPCRSIQYAVDQVAAPHSSITVLTDGSPAYTYDGKVVISNQDGRNRDGLRILGSETGGGNARPLVTYTGPVGPVLQAMLILVDGVEDVEIAGLELEVDQSRIGEGILVRNRSGGDFARRTVIRNNLIRPVTTGSPATPYGRRLAVAVNTTPFRTSPAIEVLAEDNEIRSGTNAGFRAGIAFEQAYGIIRRNTAQTINHDVLAAFPSGSNNGETLLIGGPVVRDGSGAIIDRPDANIALGGGIQVNSPNATIDAITVEGNILQPAESFAPIPPDSFSRSSMRFISGASASGIDSVIRDNLFEGHVLGLNIQNFPGLDVSGNRFTPRAGYADAVNLRIANRETSSDNPVQPPLPFLLDVRGNSFMASADGGIAVELVNDNNGDSDFPLVPAGFDAINFGGVPVDGNTFDGGLTRYFVLRDYSSDSSQGLGTYDYANFPASYVRPFGFDVDASANLFGGVASVDMTAAQRAALAERIIDQADAPVLGRVLIDFAAPLEVHVDDGYAGAALNTELAFSHAATGPRTVYAGIDAFADIPSALAAVADGGTVFIARGIHNDPLSLDRPVRLIGDGAASNNPALATILRAGINVAASGVDAGNPLLLQDFRITDVAGPQAVLVGAGRSHVELNGLQIIDNPAANAINLVAGSGVAAQIDGFVLRNSRLENNNIGIRGGSTSWLVGITLADNDLVENGTGILLSGASGSGDSLTRDWLVTNNRFLRNNLDSSIFGGGFWLKTAGTGSAIDNVEISGNLFEDNGSSNANGYNNTGISVRVRNAADLDGVRICDNVFRETPVPGLQTTGINVVVDGAASSYDPLTICNNSFDGLIGVSGAEHVALYGEPPDIVGQGNSAINGGTVYDDVGVLAGAGSVSNLTQATEYDSIGEAIAAASAGDVIELGLGTYREPVLIDRPLTLQGSDRLLSIIDGDGFGGSGISVDVGIEGVIIQRLTVQNFAAIGPGGGCVNAIRGNDGLQVNDLLVQNCQGGLGAIYAGGLGGVDDLTFHGNEVRNFNGRGIVVWDDLKTNITITDNLVYDGTGCCGIELQDGRASGVLIENNTVENVGDSGMSAVGLTSGAGANFIRGNVIRNSGRFGIEIKMPDGSGRDSGDGAIVIENNQVYIDADGDEANGVGGGIVSIRPSEVRDLAGIAVMRRGYVASYDNVDIPTGVIVRDNIVRGFQQNNPGSDSTGFGIVVEGLNMRVLDNTVGESDVAIQRQSGHLPYVADTAADGDQTNLSDAYFGRGNSPVVCAAINGNTDAAAAPVTATDVLAPGQNAEPVAINRDTDGLHCAIQLAIDDAATVDAHTVEVFAGSHDEALTVGKSIALVGPFEGVPGSNAARGNGEAVIAPSGAAGLRIDADDVRIDGLSFSGQNGFNAATSAISSGSNFGAFGNAALIRNNRFVDLDANGIYTNGAVRLIGWQVEDNLFSGIGQPGTLYSAINFWKVDGGTVQRNRIEDAAFAGIQLIGNVDATVSGNTVEGTGDTGINVGPDQVNASVFGNTVTNANGGGAADLGSITIYGGSEARIACNVVDSIATKRGGALPDSPLAINAEDLDILHNSVGSAIEHSNVGALVSGSNWYGGGAGSTAGSNAVAVSLADPVTSNPVGQAECGDNAATGVTRRSGDGQAAVVDSVFGQPLVLRITDRFGGAVAATEAGFSAPLTGAAASFPGTPFESDFNGVASGTVRANTVVGSYEVTANVAGVAAGVSWTLQNLVGTADALGIVSINPQTDVPAGTAVPSAPSVRVDDAFGNPVPGVEVVFTVASGGGSATGAVQTTDSAGVATVGAWLLGPDAATENTLSAAASVATVLFTATSATVTEVDLRVTVDNGVDAVAPGDVSDYLLSIDNPGPGLASDVMLDALLEGLDEAGSEWACAGSGGASCPAASGSGSISGLLLQLPAGGSVDLVVSALVTAEADGFVRFSVEALPAPDAVELTPLDNVDFDEDPANAGLIGIFGDGFEAVLPKLLGVHQATDDGIVLARAALPQVPASERPQAWLIAIDDSARLRSRVDAVSIGGQAFVRVSDKAAGLPGRWQAFGTSRADRSRPTAMAATDGVPGSMLAIPAEATTNWKILQVSPQR